MRHAAKVFDGSLRQVDHVRPKDPNSALVQRYIAHLVSLGRSLVILFVDDGQTPGDPDAADFQIDVRPTGAQSSPRRAPVRAARAIAVARDGSVCVASATSRFICSAAGTVGIFDRSGGGDALPAADDSSQPHFPP